jgi:hypothetical protein
VLGINAILGRTIVPEDDQPSAPPVAVVSARYWRSRFGSDPQTVGKVIRINNVPVTIVGVLPPEFTGIQLTVSDPPDVAVPLSLDGPLSTGPAEQGSRMNQPTYWWLQVMGRLKPGATAAQVHGNLEGVFQQTARAGLKEYWHRYQRASAGRCGIETGPRCLGSGLIRKPRRLRRQSHGQARGGHPQRRRDPRAADRVRERGQSPALEGDRSKKEISVRLSLGATRPRLIRQLLTESLLLASLGGVLGVLVGYWGQRLLPGPPGQATSLDWRVLAFVLGVTGLTGLIFGVAPALRATGMSVSTALKENGRGVVGSRSLLSRLLLIVQVAISLVLLVGADSSSGR